MVKLNLMRFSALVFACFFATTTNAQTKIWGAGAPVGDMDGQFANALVQSTTASNYDPAAWTALSVSQGGGGSAAFWTRNLTGYSAGAYAGTTPMPSPSQANGVAIFDSDFLDNNGNAGQFGTGTSPTPHRGELISPRINLTGYTDSALVIRFFSEYREFRINELSVSLSVDDGVTWVNSELFGSTRDYRAVQGSSSPGWINALFLGATQGVANLTNCRIRFVFDNDYYYAMVDDVTLQVAPTYDIAIGSPDTDPNNTTLVGGGDHVKIGNNAYIPMNNVVHSNDMREWFWGGKLSNYGSQNLLPADSAAMYVNIDYVDPVSGSTTPGVYVDTIYFDTIVAGDFLGRTNIEYLNDKNFISTYGEGAYQVTYVATHKHAAMDGTADNDTARYTFNITGSAPLNQYLSKARLNANDGRVFASRGIFPSGGPYQAFEYGSVYFFPRGASDSINIDSVVFRYRLSNAFTGAATQTMYCNVYSLDASAGVVNDDNLLTQVGLSPVSVTGLGTTVQPNGFGLATATNFIDAAQGTPMGNFTDNGFYFISIVTNTSLGGGAATFTVNDVPLIGGDDYNYYMNTAMTRADSVVNPSPLKITDGAGSGTWYWSGFGSDVVPAIGIYLSIKPSIVSTNTIWTEEGSTLNVYPNPASNVVNFDFELDQAEDVTYILTDMTGRVITMINSTNVSKETRTLDISNLTSGVYMLTAKTATKSSTEKFIVR